MFIEDLISRDLPITPERVRSLASNTSAYYRSFLLGDRKIDAPMSELKLIQCWVSDFIRAETDSLPEFVTAYEPKSSIRKNAAMHCRMSHQLCVDIKSFFSSCSAEKVAYVFENMRLSKSLPDGRFKLAPNDVELLVDLVTLHGSLSVGSPSSPSIANRVMLPADLEIMAVLGRSCVYSRYSDDICISSNNWLDEEAALEAISGVLAKYSFQLNEGKTRCCGRGNARRITGVFITPDGKLSVGSKRKRALEKGLYEYLVNDVGSADQLLGLLNFCSSIEPSYAGKIIAKYSNYGRAAEYEGVVDALRRGCRAV